MFTGKVPGRFEQIQSDIMQYQKGNANTSIGARLQLWETSWKVFTKHPLTGIGGRSKSFQKNMVTAGRNFAPETARQTHAHNEFLQRAIRYGILGGIMVIAVFLVPFIYFVSYIRSSDSVLRTTAFMGAVYHLFFLFFGLSDVIFEWRITIQFYVVVSSILLAALIKRKEKCCAAFVRQ
ncbi:MAG: O-antigen ligase family protein [Oxalobacter formigenes]|nr:O-antigen ligase family protein [Oxalobacter formigenes]